MAPSRVHIQSAITEEKHPDLYQWWTTTQQERSEIVRVALRRYIMDNEQLTSIKNQLDRVEKSLERCMRILEGKE